MKSVEGDALDELMGTYTRLTHEFELKNGYAYKSEITGVLKGLGFGEEDFEKAVDTISGGQKNRVSLGRLLLSNPDILLLDEPTDHLDMQSISWLETYLKGYPGAVILVAHDRYFLNRIVTKVVELERTKATVYQGNYTDFARKKAMLRDALVKQYLNQQRERRHQEDVIAELRSVNREKSIRRAESREKLLNKMEVLEKPAEDTAQMRIHLEPRITSGNDVLSVENLSKSFPPLELFRGIHFCLLYTSRCV